jgi:magnesium transporter
MNLKMQLLSQVATICLPLNLVAGIFGMNVNVPYAQTDGYTSLTPFFVIVGCMAFWLVLLSPPLIKTFLKIRREKQIERKSS